MGARMHTVRGVATALAVASAIAGVAGTASGKSGTGGRPLLIARLSLTSARVAPNGTVRGKLILVNRTSTAKVVLRACAIDGLYAIALRASDGYLQEPAFAVVACRQQQAITAKPGTTAIRFKIHAAYTACTSSLRQPYPRRSKNWLPPCLKDARGSRDVMPPLPAGSYTVLFFPNGKWLGPAVKPATLLVSKAG